MKRKFSWLCNIISIYGSILGGLFFIIICIIEPDKIGVKIFDALIGISLIMIGVFGLKFNVRSKRD
jgi:hypothetical protein